MQISASLKMPRNCQVVESGAAVMFHPRCARAISTPGSTPADSPKGDPFPQDGSPFFFCAIRPGLHRPGSALRAASKKASAGLPAAILGRTVHQQHASSRRRLIVSRFRPGFIPQIDGKFIAAQCCTFSSAIRKSKAAEATPVLIRSHLSRTVVSRCGLTSSCRRRTFPAPSARPWPRRRASTRLRPARLRRHHASR